MDKQENQKTITIKINGRNRSYSEQWTRSENASSETSKGFLESAAANEAFNDEDEFEWILPDKNQEEETKEVKSVSHQQPSSTVASKIKRRTNNRMMSPVIFTVIFAVLVGTSLGMIILKLIITEEVTVPDPSHIPKEVTQEQQVEHVAVQITIPTLTGYVVQAGAFSSVEAAQSEQRALISKGIPASVIDSGDKVYVYVGVADSLEKAKEIKAKLEAQGIETYAKEAVFGGHAQIQVDESEKKLLDSTPSYYETLSTMHSATINTGAIPGSLYDTFTQKSNEWASLKDIKNEQLQMLKAELDGASLKMNSYQNSQDARLLVEIEQHLLQFLSIFQLLR